MYSVFVWMYVMSDSAVGISYYHQSITEQPSTLTDLHMLQGNIYHIKLLLQFI